MMTDTDYRTSKRSETIRSPVLYLKEITVTESENARGRRLFSGTRLKSLIFPFLYWVIRFTSVSVALIPVRVFLWGVRLLYLWPGNPLRLSCRYLSHYADRRGYQHKPGQIYLQFLNNLLGVMESYFLLHSYGIHRVADRVTLAPEDSRMMQDQIGKYGGAILCVPHNIANAFSSLKLNQVFPLLVVAKNSATIARTKIALDYFERMKVPVLMVRDGNPFQLSRTLFSVLDSGKAVAATLDNIDSGDNRPHATMFGHQVALSGWAAKIATRMQVPIIPCYFSSSGSRIKVIFGKPLVTADVEEAVQHYADFFEQNILRDPASWAYLADKHWRRILCGAANPGD